MPWLDDFQSFEQIIFCFIKILGCYREFSFSAASVSFPGAITGIYLQ
jgi:hypothetical protein